MNAGRMHLFTFFIRISLIFVILLPMGLQWRNPEGFSSIWTILLCSVVISIGWTLYSLKVIWNRNYNTCRLVLLGGLCIEISLLIFTILYHTILPNPLLVLHP